MITRKPRLLRITTVPISLKLLLNGQLSYFQEKQFNVLAVSAEGPEVVDSKIDGVDHVVVPMTRKITPFQDLVSLLKLIFVIRKFRPDIVHSHTPKAGLIGMLAAWICRVPVRMHTVAGLPLMEKRGVLRKLLIWIERVTYACATNVYPNSQGLKDFIARHVSASPKLKIIGKGSSNGIDTHFFRRTDWLESEARRIRQQYNIKPDDIVLSFVGRVVKDKGISELIQSYIKVRETSSPAVFLLIVGPLEQDLDPINPGDLHFLTNDPRVILAGYQRDVRPFIIASDIFVFPSYREGFPNVVMQACCLKVPCIVSDINGCNEIISNRQTGLVVPPKDTEALYRAMMTLITEEETRLVFSNRAFEEVSRNYDQRVIWTEISSEYDRNLASAAHTKALGFRVYRDVIKPLMDFMVALIGLVVASPVILICMGLLVYANRGKIWFTQVRPGKFERLFRVVKFRTMSDERDADGNLLPDEKRLHGIGKFIRKTSLDELPQLINVLKGDMSLVGPRPLLEEYLPLYSEEQRRRHDVKPGITGWAQVNGRNAISWQQKFSLDIWYVENQSFFLDLKILFLTVFKVFKAEGITSATSVTMEKFRGN